jgi:regulatory protein
MAVISKITIQKKNKERYNIFLDEEYAFSVDEAILISYNLRKGLEVTKEFLADIVDEDHIRKGYQSAINYLSYRMRSVKEVQDYLRKKELENEVINKIVDRLMNEKYLSDSEFAKAFVQTRLNLTLKGPEAIRRELIEKGVGEAEIEESLQLYSISEQLEKAVKFIKKKYPTKLKTSRMEQDQKIHLLLVSNGFSHDIVKQAFKLFYEEAEDETDEEWDAIKYQGEKAFKKYRSVTGWEKNQKVKQFLYRRGFSFDLIEKFLDYYEEDGE